MHRTLAIGVVIGVIAAACTSASPDQPPPSTLTTTATTLTTSTTTTTQPTTTTALFGEPVDLVAYPPTQAADEQIGVCGTVPTGLDPVFSLTTTDDATSTGIGPPSSAVNGAVARCWTLTLPAVDPGDYRLEATVGGQVVGVGPLRIVEPFEKEVAALPWRADPALTGQMVPVAVSNAHAAGATDVVVHGVLTGTVDVALPPDAYTVEGATVHLWSDPDGQPPEPIYDIFSDVTGNWLYRGGDFELGDRGFVDAALASPQRRPAMSIAQALAWDAMGRRLVPYLRLLESGDDGWRRTKLSLYDPSNGHTYHLSLQEGSGEARDEWGYEPLHSGYMEGLGGSNGRYSVQLGVWSRVSEGDVENPTEPPPLEVDIDDLGRMLDAIITTWESHGAYPDGLLSYEARHLSFLRSVVRNADAQLNGPFTAVDWTGETEPAPNQIPVVADDGTRPWVTFHPAPEATAKLGTDATMDLDGPQAVFVTPDASWFFCLDTGFSLPSDTDLAYVRSLPSGFCRFS